MSACEGPAPAAAPRQVTTACKAAPRSAAYLQKSQAAQATGQEMVLCCGRLPFSHCSLALKQQCGVQCKLLALLQTEVVLHQPVACTMHPILHVVLQICQTGIPQSRVWELDFSSRPILDERGKKKWELLICDAQRHFQYSGYFPNNKINSTQVGRPHLPVIACIAAVPSALPAYKQPAAPSSQVGSCWCLCTNCIMPSAFSTQLACTSNCRS